MRVATELFNNAETIGEVRFIKAKVDTDVNQAKNLAHKLRSMADNVFVVLALVSGDKVNLVVALSDDLLTKGMDAGKIIREISQPIKGGGGGQPHLATAGGKDASGIEQAFELARKLLA
jgi:alanyl-tRNA synthetase